MKDYNPFYDDVKERNSMKSGSFHKVNGSKSKKCTLPSDNLTPAQKRKLNGPVVSWNVKAPMSWTEFKHMPATLQKEHLAFVQAEFHTPYTVLAEEYFCITRSALSVYASSKGIKSTLSAGTRVRDEDRERLRRWKSGETEAPEEPVVVVDAAAEEEDSNTPTRATEPEKSKFVVDHLSAHISGSADDLLTYVRVMLGGRSAEVRISITFKEEMNNEK